MGEEADVLLDQPLPPHLIAPNGQQQQQPMNFEADSLRKPLRFMFMDAECLQMEQNELANEGVDLGGREFPAGTLKHVPLLVCSEVICERCIHAGVQLSTEPMRKADGCVCGVPWRGAERRLWCVPVEFDLQPGELERLAHPLPPDGLNPRRLAFHSFQNPQQSPMALFVDFLLNTGKKDVTTICLSHNGVIFFNMIFLLKKFNYLF